MPRLARRTGLVLTAATAAATTAFMLVPSPASASPTTPSFGPGIEALAPYVGQSTCSPSIKAGTEALRSVVLAAYRSTGDLGIVRACNVGGQSEHKEGRAWDWAVNVSNSTQEAGAQDFFRWLLATDRYGNNYANARRLGIMYMIHNRMIWSAYNASAGWRPYTGPNPHTDHVHISLSWSGGLKNSTFWHPSSTTTSGSAAAAISAAWTRLGGSAVVGSATTPTYSVTGGFARNYTHGRIFYSGATGAHIVKGGILSKYLVAGGPYLLGLPTSDERRVVGGWSNTFTRATIYGSISTGAHVVRGGILPKYLSLGGPAVLGMPTSDELVVPGGWVNIFQHGRVYGGLANGAHVVKGGILGKYVALGGSAKLGMPTSDERTVTGGWAGNFTKGRIYGSLAHGAHPVTGPVLDRYLSLSGAAGSLGLPTSDPTPIRSGLLTRFQNGGIVLQSDGQTRLTA